MPEVKLFPSTLVSSDADNPKLANTDNLYDRPRKAFQDVINSNLVESDDALSGNIQALMNRIIALESAGSVIRHCDEDGLFIVDDQKRIGACIISPNIRYGWDGVAAASSPTLTKNNGGWYIVVPGADFSSMNIGTLENISQVDIEGISLSYPAWVSSDEPNKRKITATPDANHSNYNGGYVWTVTKGSSYLALDPNPQYGSTATFSVLSAAASASSVEVTCQAKNNPQVLKTITFDVKYTQPETKVTGVNIYYTESGNNNNSQANPIEDTSFGLRAVGLPNGVSIATYAWSIVDGSASVQFVTGADKQQVSIGIKDTATTAVKCTIKCEVQDNTSSPASVSNTIDVWVKYQSAYDRSVVDDIVIDYADQQTTAKQDLTVRTVPVQQVPENVEFKVLEGRASVTQDGVLSLGDDSVAGEIIKVEATMPNPDYDSSIQDSKESFSSTAIITSEYTVPLREIRIEGGNRDVEGQNIQLYVTAQPDRSEYRAVTWKMVSGNSRYVSLTEQGMLIVSPLLGSQVTMVEVEARSAVDTSIADQVRLRVKYAPDTTVGTDYQHLASAIAVGGDYAIIYPYVYKTGYGDGVWLNPEDVEITLSTRYEDFMTEEEVQNDINSNISSSPAYARASTTLLLPLNNTKDATLLEKDMKYYLKTDYEDMITQQGIIYDSDAPGKGGLLLAASNSGSPTLNGNILDFSYLEAGHTTGVDLRYKYTFVDSNGNTRTLTSGGYHEFTRYPGKLPVTSITLTKHAFTGCAPQNQDISMYVQPVCAEGKTVNDYLFDRNKVQVNQINGDYDSAYSKVVGRWFTVKAAAGTGVQEQWDIAYLLMNEHTSSLPASNKWITGNYTSSNIGSARHEIRPRIVNRETVSVSYNNAVANTSTISIALPTNPLKVFTVDTPNSTPDGGQLSAVNQNNYPVSVTWSIIGGNTADKVYCSINSATGFIRVYDTGGEEITITVKAVTSNGLSATANFKVKSVNS